uniref:Putative secreted protein n=1 Tax=Ixodes scapularis TaxID=6945 RepID=A0A4D5RZ53_IXOSC
MAWGTWPTRTWTGFLLITWTTCIRFQCEDALQTMTSTCHRPSSREVCHQIRGIHLHLAGTDRPPSKSLPSLHSLCRFLLSPKR